MMLNVRAWANGQADDATADGWVYDTMDPIERRALRKELVAEQGYVCLICERPFDQPDAGYLDHDHESGYVRAVLCCRCNQIVGALESPWVHRAQAFLRSWSFAIDLWANLEGLA